MLNRIKKMPYLLLLMIALLGFHTEAYAEQLNNSVKECIENPKSCDNQFTNQTKNNDKKQVSESVGLNIIDFFKMIMATIFVVFLLYYLLKMINKKNKSFGSSQLIENLGGTSLGTNRSVQIIKVGNQLLVIGVGESIQLLKEITDHDEYNRIIKEYNERMDQMTQPSDIVTKVLNKMKKSSSVHHKNGSHFQVMLKNHLNELVQGRKNKFMELEEKGKPEDE
ncbi:flagellar biosynthetic protein FliO [Bacillus sp. 03113]|uniref:flagellar biosynthetic protein FliO n=1 Tax=Bacillus sp. 03113 TaxID=2578211 RepID=UPI001141E658|nr:flagellar biosynthetic protein FliO [Bacillus sp. 03113]